MLKYTVLVSLALILYSCQPRVSSTAADNLMDIPTGFNENTHKISETFLDSILESRLLSGDTIPVTCLWLDSLMPRGMIAYDEGIGEKNEIKTAGFALSQVTRNWIEAGEGNENIEIKISDFIARPAIIRSELRLYNLKDEIRRGFEKKYLPSPDSSSFISMQSDSISGTVSLTACIHFRFIIQIQTSGKVEKQFVENLWNRIDLNRFNHLPEREIVEKKKAVQKKKK